MKRSTLPCWQKSLELKCESEKGMNTVNLDQAVPVCVFGYQAEVTAHMRIGGSRDKGKIIGSNGNYTEVSY